MTEKISKKAAILIDDNNLECWNNVPNKSKFLSDLVNGFFNQTTINLKVPNSLEAALKNLDCKSDLVNRLVTEYLRGNIIFIDEYVRMVNLHKRLGGADFLDAIPQQTNNINLGTQNNHVNLNEDKYEDFMTSDKNIKSVDDELSVEKENKNSKDVPVKQSTSINDINKHKEEHKEEHEEEVAVIGNVKNSKSINNSNSKMNIADKGNEAKKNLFRKTVRK